MPRDPNPVPSDGESRREFLAQATAIAMVGSLLPGEAKEETWPAVKFRVTVNGKGHDLTFDPRVTLLDALRERLGLTGSKKGCDAGACGACTLLVDGRRVNSCLTLAVAVAGKKVTTIEGLGQGDELHPLQRAFIDHDGFQCGYCTPGQICSAAGLMSEGVAETADEVREWMSGNLCRCGAYPNIVKAITGVIAEAKK
jgi:xanthine dehydrogenase YagT iron-sulfur-binding subunit